MDTDPADYDHLEALGVLALANRFRRLADRLTARTRTVYGESGSDFEPRWFPLFSLLLDREHVTVGSAARALAVSHVAVSRLARQMADRGLLAMHPDAEDGRVTQLALTPAGDAEATRLEPLWGELTHALEAVVAEAGPDLLPSLGALDRAVARHSIPSARHRNP